MIVHSEQQEQAFILDYFGKRCHYPAHSRFFVDIGALDGVRLSNTRALAEYGWKGLLIEPLMSNWEKLVQNCAEFPKLRTLQAAVVGDGFHASGMMKDLYIDSGDPARCSLFESMTNQFVRYDGMTTSVPVITVEDLITSHISRHVDFLTIDAESMDEQIIMSWPLTKNAPDLIMLETLHDPSLAGGVSEKLEAESPGEFEYSIVFQNSHNTAWGKTCTYRKDNMK